LLNEIEDKLKEFEAEYEDCNFRGVAYGAMPANASAIKNYIVFNRYTTERKGAGYIDFTKYFNIIVVHEDYIPEDVELECIKKLSEIKGLKLASDIEYEYALKKGTNTVVEMASFLMSRAFMG
jgi:hypothetical protein